MEPDRDETLPEAPRDARDPRRIGVVGARASRRPLESFGSSSGGSRGLGSSRRDPFELPREEAARARGFAVVAILVAALGFALEPVLGGALGVRAASVGGLVALGAVAAAVRRRASDPLRYTRVAARGFGVAWLLGATALTYRLGVFSPAPVLTALAVTFFGLGEDRLLAGAFTALAAAGYALLATLIAIGTLPDAGFLRVLTVAPEVRAALVVLVPLSFALAHWQARVSRRAALEAIQRSNDWFREVRQREVQLEEANHDLDMLLKMSAGEIAPYTGITAGKYVLAERIGRGAMGEIYAARHAATGSTAAVKLLHPSMHEDAMLMQRFLREGEAASKLVAKNVVSIYEVGKLDNGAPYIAMELLRGHDLGWHLRRRGQLSLDEALLLVEQVAAGLDAARLGGVVHRDLKPPNLFLAQQPNDAPMWKILDFGVSRMAGSSGTLTKDIIVGTPGYMSPEQACGLAATHRSDVFALGAVVYRALTGSPPFTAEDMPQTLYQVVYRNPPRPSELARALPPDVDLVLAVALAKDPADRFASAPAMADALKAASRHALDPELRVHARTLLAALPWSDPPRDSLDALPPSAPSPGARSSGRRSRPSDAGS